MSTGFVVWFTGLSGAGKSTLAAMLSAELRARGLHVEVLDGDEVRTHLSKGLGFSREDRDTNVRRVGFVAKLLARAGACAITAAISPYRAVRDEQRAQTPRFFEVHVQCAVPTLAERDAKGLYKKALAGEIKHFTGIDDPYEAPEHPEVTVDTAVESKEESLARILRALEAIGYVPRHEAVGAATTRAGAAPALIAPHGGELVDLLLRGDAREALAERAKGLAVIELDRVAEDAVELLASGALSPLRGFMNEKDHRRVVREMRLENGLPWPTPITLAITEATAAQVAIGAQVALRARDGRLAAVLEVSDVFRPDQEVEALALHGTIDPANAEVAALRARGPVYLGGEIRALSRAAPAVLGLPRDPRETRAQMQAMGWARVVGFQTARPMLRADEHLARTALELCDGLLIQALIGPSGDDDLPVDVRVRCHEALIARYFPRDRVLLALGPGSARPAGPRQALLQALVHRNHGCSHVVVGRDPEGYAGDAGAIDPRSSFAIFGRGELGVEPLFFEETLHSTVIDATATTRTAPGDASTWQTLPAPELRAMLARGEAPPAPFMRPEVAQILLKAMHSVR